MRVEKMAAKIAEELGEKLDQEIGSGDFGIAYLLESGKVLKLTSDTNEVIIAKKLTKNKNLFKNILNYYNVGEIGRTDKPDYQNNFTYFILMDYAEPLSDGERKVINYVYKPLLQFSKSFYNSTMSDSFVTYVKYQFNKKRLLQTPSITKYFDVDELEKIAFDFVPLIREIAKDLKLHHIDQCDFHGGNVGWNEDHTRLVLFDISKPWTGADIPDPKVKKYAIFEYYSPSKIISTRIKEIAEELGEEIENYLGGGAYGYSFKTKSGKVLKITSDNNEVHTAYKLSKNKKWFRYLVNYYNVGKIDIKNSGLGLDSNVYQWYILMDYVEPLTEEEQDAVHCYMTTMQNNSSYYKDISKKDEMIEDIEYVYRPGSFNYNRAKAHNRDPERIKQIAIDIYPKVLKIAKELKLQHIAIADFHEGNVGWDKDHENLIFYDLGGESNYALQSKNKFKEISTSEKFITRFKRFDEKK